MELHELSALELSAAYRCGDTDPIEVVDNALNRAETVGEQVGAFAHLAPELARKQAEAAREALKTGDSRPLLGVPCPIKDLSNVAGLPTGSGTVAIDPVYPENSDGVVTTLAEAGTINLGKTSVPEFGLVGYTEPEGATPARTPWDLSRTAGGSSGGAAAAVATGISPIAHGSDGGGSIRIPAACCGIVGLKPSRGRISSGPWANPGLGLTTSGILSRTVADAALGLDIMAVNHPGDFFPPISVRGRSTADSFSEATRIAPADIRSDKHADPIRVGLLTEAVIVESLQVHPAALESVKRTALVLESLGCEVEPVSSPFSAAKFELFMTLWAVGTDSVSVPPENRHRLKPVTQWLGAQAKGVTGTDLVSTIDAFQTLARDVGQKWEKFDVILSPTLSGPALTSDQVGVLPPEQDWELQKQSSPWTSLFNTTGAPAISLPLYTATLAASERLTATGWTAAETDFELNPHRAQVKEPGVKSSDLSEDARIELPLGIMLSATQMAQEHLILSLAAALHP